MNLFTKYFISIFFPWVIVLCLFFTYFFFSQGWKINTLRLENERINIQVGQRAIHQEFQTVMSDALILSQHNSFQCRLHALTSDAQQRLEFDFMLFSKMKGVHDQVRFLDTKGQEIARVNYDGGKVTAVPETSLQNKGTRYYFLNSLATPRSKLYISPLDLNMEHGEIELPHKPMIRFGTPVFNPQGEKMGILLLNYLAENLLNHFSDSVAPIRDHVSILNEEGYWLKNPQPDKEWGFMFKNNHNINNSHPEEWKRVLSEENGQFYTKNGLFTYTTIHLFQSLQLNNEQGVAEKKYAKDSAYLWKVVSHITPEIIYAEKISRVTALVKIATPIFVLLIIFSWRLALARVKNKQDEILLKQQATIDPLTRLPNRQLFHDRLSRCLLNSKRLETQFALLFIDLDRFKTVNDTLGHAAGDHLLQEVAERLQQSIRESDTVARIGGDEFTIILNSITESSGVTRVAQIIVDILSEPFLISEEHAEIGASVGIAIYPQDGTDGTSLMQNADKAMYEAKKNGKSRFCFFDTIG